jgi:hypothetical protein
MRSGEVPGEGGEYGPVRPGQPWPGAKPTAQHGYFVAQRQQLDVLGSLRTEEQEEQPEEADKSEVDHAERHGARACHDQARASKSQVEAGTRVMAPHRYLFRCFGRMCWMSSFEAVVIPGCHERAEP